VRNAWVLDRAVDAFFNQNKAPAAKKIDLAKLNKVFDQYCGSDEKTKNVVQDEKLAQFFEDHDVDPSGIVTLGVAWKLQAKTLGAFTRKEFVDGFSAAGVETSAQIKAYAKKIESTLEDDKTFKEFYRWLFDYVKDEGERKTLDVQVALDMWSVVLPKRFGLLAEWVEFVEGQKMKVVSKDLWQQVYEFGRDVKPDFANYEDDGKWRR